MVFLKDTLFNCSLQVHRNMVDLWCWPVSCGLANKLLGSVFITVGSSGSSLSSGEGLYRPCLCPRAGIACRLPVLGRNIRSLPITWCQLLGIWYLFFISKVKEFPFLLLVCWEFLSLMLNFALCFFCITWCNHMLFLFSLPVWLIFEQFSLPCIPGINPHPLGHGVLFFVCVAGLDILMFCGGFYVYTMWNIGLLFSCNVFVWLWCQGDVPHGINWEMFPSVYWKRLYRIGIIPPLKVW